MITLEIEKKKRKFLQTNLINIRSSHLSTSGPSSVSALKIATLAIKTAAASWSKPAEMCCILVVASAQLKKRIKCVSSVGR